MALVPSKLIVDEALKGQYGVGAYNVNNMEQIQAIMMAAKETKSPLIVQASRGALQYAEMTYLWKLMEAAAELNPEIPMAIHLDHGNSLETCKQAIELGFTSVMIDGSLKEDSKTPTTYQENVDVTASVVEYAHRFGISVEGEIGTLGGIEDGVGSGEIHVTDPEEAERFRKETGVDMLAVAIGTSHGAYKFKEEPTLAMDVVEEIHRRMPDLPLVMHGSSSVPEELVAEVNTYGGAMPDAKGVPIPAIQEGIKRGVAKVNVDTDGRMAVTAAVRKVFQEKPEEFDPRKYLGPARDALAKLIAGKMRDFGTAGHVGDYALKTIDDYKAMY